MNALKIALRDLLVVVNDRSGTMYTIVMPLVFCFMFSFTAPGGSEQTPKAGIEVVDRDGGFLAKAFTDCLEGEGIWVQRFTAQNAPETPGRRRLTLVEGFTEKIQAGEQIRLPLSEWPMQNDWDIIAKAQVYRALVKFMGRYTLAMNSAQHKPSETDLQEALTIPALVQIEARSANIPTIPQGYMHTVPRMLVMFVMMNTLIFGGIIIALDRTMGRFQRLLTTPTSPWEIIGGHILGSIWIAGAQILMFLIAGPVLFGINWGGHWGALGLILLALMVCCASLSVWIGSIARKEAHVLAIGPPLVLVMAALGGCWWPLEIVPESIRWLAYAVPTGWAVDGIYRVLSFDRGLTFVYPNILILLAFSVPFALTGIMTIRRGVS